MARFANWRKVGLSIGEFLRKASFQIVTKARHARVAFDETPKRVNKPKLNRNDGMIHRQVGL